MVCLRGGGVSGGDGGGGAAVAAVAAADSPAVKGRAPRTGHAREWFGSANRRGTRVSSVLRRANETFVQLIQGVVGCAY
jgi:hypothetical protein